MSMSTPQGGGSSRRQTVVSTGSPAKKAATKATPPKQGGKGAKGGGPRKPVTAVKVQQPRNWGPIALFAAVGLLAAGIIGVGGWYVYQGTRTWEDKAGAISGIVNFRKTKPETVRNGVHQEGTIAYPMSPPAGGPHNPAWQRCMGDVYDAQIASEHAVHSMEHGAVWVTYRPDLPKDQIDALAAKVRGNDYLLMSPFPGLDKPISLQAWGYQLKVNSASDKRIDEFIKVLAKNATMEPGTVCSGGNYVTATGSTPRDMSQQQSGTGG
jgi:hypothetical protein